jgi:hypothetical protein
VITVGHAKIAVNAMAQAVSTYGAAIERCVPRIRGYNGAGFKGVGCLESFHIPLSSAFIWNPADLWFATVLEVGKGPQEEKSG